MAQKREQRKDNYDHRRFWKGLAWAFLIWLLILIVFKVIIELWI